MIEINELRRLAQAATPGPWYIGSGTYEGRNIYSAEAVTDDEGFTYNPVVATAEDDGVVCWDANARLIAAANPAAITELLDRLEAAERERDALRAALEKSADWNCTWGPYPETNEAWRAMALVTAREAVRKEYF